MRILLTGGSGYIGKKMIQRLASDGHKICIVLRKNSDVEDVKKYIERVIYNINYSDVYNQIKDFKPECYINVAGKYYGTHNADTIQEMIEANILFPTLVLDAAIKAGCENVIHTSSFQQCYQGERYNPVNMYAATKQSFEDILKYYVECKVIKVIVLQLFDTYGADDTRNKIFNRIRRLKEDESIELSSGMQKMFFCYIDDVIEAYAIALKQTLSNEFGFMKKYAIRGEKPIELKKFIEWYCSQMNRVFILNWGEREYLNREIMDPTGYGEVLPGWKTQITYEHGIELCAAFDKE